MLRVGRGTVCQEVEAEATPAVLQWVEEAMASRPVKRIGLASEELADWALTISHVVGTAHSLPSPSSAQAAAKSALS